MSDSAAKPDANPDLLRHSSLQDQMVLDYDTTETVGTVDLLLADIKQGRVEGLVCKAGLIGRQKEQIAWPQIESIGTDSLVVRLQAGANQVGLDAAQSAIGLEVWTDAGNKAGHIVDFQFSRGDGEIVWYLFTAEGLQSAGDGLYGLQPSDILSAGRKRIMVSAAAAEQAPLRTEGFNQRAAQAAEFVRADYSQTQQDWQSLVSGAKRFGKKFQQRAQELKDYTQDHLPEITEQLQGQTQQASHTVQQRVEDIRNRFQKQTASTNSDTTETIDLDTFEVWEED
ncbi:MAG: PRC-barrel domain-containing protein [Cyanobacteria bacterium J06632_22]